MYTNLIRNNNYNYSIVYERPQTKLKDLSSPIILTEKNDSANDIYRNAATRATMIADIDRYSQGTFDLSLLVAGRNADSYFTGKLDGAYDVDYFHVDTSSQLLSKRPVIVNMEMPEGADYDLTVYDNKGNQVGMAVTNEDGAKTLTIPCDWSNCHNFVIKISRYNSEKCVERDYKLTFSQGDIPQETIEWIERMKNVGVVESTQKKRSALANAVGEKFDAKNAEGIRKLHQAQYDALPEELKYSGRLSAEELLEKEKSGEALSQAERVYVAIYGNQNDIYQVESIKKKQSLEQEFTDYLEAIGLSGEQFEVRLIVDGKAEIIGLSEEQQKQVENFVETHWDSFKHVYLTNSEDIAKMTDLQFRLAGYVEECNRFLSSVSGGNSSVWDLTIQMKQTGQYSVREEIVGLPSKVARLINSADSASRFYDYKQMLYDILEYKRVNGEVPQYNMHFKWIDNRLTI